MSGKKAMLAIPPAVRAQVDERDQGYCRRCGRFEGQRRVHHHIRYGGDDAGMGGRRFHHVDNLVTLCWDCHAIVHSRKLVWRPLLEAVIARPGRTALQLQRWAVRNGR